MSRPIVGGSIRRALCTAIALVLAVASGHAPVGAVQERAARPGGQSVTILPDGRQLLIGGDATRGLVAIANPLTGTVQTLPVSPLVPRTWHTATLLADGTVLVVGGVDANGRTISAPERFNLTTRSFESLSSDGFAPRARHTATLLTDGRVLIAGGQAMGGAAEAELWSSQTESVTVLNASTVEDRVGHTATLLADGRVLLEGGDTPRASLHSEVFDPRTNVFERFRGAARDPEIPSVVASSPGHGDADVPVDARLAIRFSSPMAPASVASGSVSLAGPDGPVDAVVVPAEVGRLAFIWPMGPLAPDTRYRLTVDGAVTADSRPLARFAMSFATAKEQPAPDVDTENEEWEPDPADRRRWRTDRPDSPWQMLPPLQAPTGATALAGQALTLAGRPLADVTLTIDGRTAQTDRTGRFLLELDNVRGGRHELEIEGATANRPGRTYGFFEAGVSVAVGRTSVLPYTIWMPKIDTAHTVTISSPTTADVVITTPKIPGLELHLPRGSVIKDRHGKVVREVNITPIPVDRPPFPLPKHIDVPVYFTIQPGGAYVYSATYQPRKARLIYPNYYDTPKGVIANFWQYDPEELDWYVYGAGQVTGKQVVPDPGVGLYEFTGAMMDTTNTPPATAAAPGGGPPAADPVDVGTGLFVLQKTDLVLPDVLPINLSRTYRPNDPVSRAFGLGASHPYAMRLWSAQNYQQADLILPDGGRIHYVRTSAGTGFVDAVYEHTATPTPFYKSRLAWNGAGWDLTLRDGTVYVFGDVAPLQAIRDRFGNIITIEHSNGTQGNVTRVVSQNGRSIAFTYDGSNRITQARDHIGRTVGYQYDASGRVWKVTDPAGGVTEYTYDASHRLLTIKDARNIVYLTNTYDANGRVATQTLAGGATWGFAYTLSNGKVTQADVTDPRGHVTRTTFNSSQYALSSVEAVGLAEQRTTTYTRDATSNRVTTVVDPLSRRTDFTYGTDGHVTSETQLAGTPDAVTTTFTYEPKYGLPATVTDPLSHTTSFAYDTLGRLTTVTDALGHQTTFTYNVAGQPLTIANDVSETTQLGYDRGDLVSVTNPLGQSALQYVDAAGRVLRALDPLGQATTYEYSVLNQVTKVIDPLAGQTTFTYDANGNLLTLTDARAKTTTWTYDNMDRVATRTDPLARAESFTYNEQGAVKTWTDRKGQVTAYTYDGLDRQTFVGFGATGTPPSYTSSVTTTYDAGDRATSVVDSVAGTISRTYDLLDRLTQEVTPEGTVTYTYDAADRLATMQVVGQTAVSYTYDNADRLTGITKGTSSVSLGYDTVDRRTSLTLPNGIVVEYGYDTASQLTALTYKLGGTTLGNLDYTYDTNGQRVAVGGTYARTGLPAALASATYDDANQIATWAGTSFTYDLNGNLASDGSKTYTWNTRNQLIGLSGGVSASFQYDGFGRRRAKTISGSSTGFLYDGLNAVQELTGASPSANILAGLGTDEWITRTDAAGTRHFLGDVLGSTLALVDSAGAVQTEYTYQPFGQPTVSGAPNGNGFQFTGRENDGTGLYYYRARYYDPQRQRFSSEDPIGFESGDVNLYAYVSNTPAIYVDPTGMSQQAPKGPPPIQLPPGHTWRPVPGTPERPVKWVPKPPVPSPKGSQPQTSWDPLKKPPHWDYDPGDGSPRRHIPPAPTIPGLPWRLPFPLPIVINPCLLDPMICQPPPGRKEA
jgi:RHS repeat-associated protein